MSRFLKSIICLTALRSRAKPEKLIRGILTLMPSATSNLSEHVFHILLSIKSLLHHHFTRSVKNHKHWKFGQVPIKHIYASILPTKVPLDHNCPLKFQYICSNSSQLQLTKSTDLSKQESVYNIYKTFLCSIFKTISKRIRSEPLTRIDALLMSCCYCKTNALMQGDDF